MKWKCMSAALSGLLVAAPGAWAAGFAIWTYDGDKAGDALGRSVARLGDVNGDGVPEVVAGAPLNEGRVQVHNGATGTRIWTRSGPDPFSDSFGWSVAGVGDVDGDGIPDVGATAPSYQAPFDTFARGRAYILSGATGATICQWEAASELTLYGQVIAGVLDTDASGVNDVAVGAPIEGPGGVVHVYSGSSCAEIWTIAGTANSPVGSAVSAAGDIDGDSRDDVLVGSAGNDTVAPDAGAAFVYSKLPLLPFGVPIMSWFGENNGDFFGTSVVGLRRNVAGGPDLDVVIGAPYFDNGALSNSGKAYLYSGGTLVYERYGGADDQNFGSAVANAGDATGDGVRDWAVSSAFLPGAPGASDQFAVFSGADGAVQGIYHETQPDDGFGFSTDGLNFDVDGDGNRDSIVGSPGYFGVNGAGSGRITMFSPRPPAGGGCAMVAAGGVRSDPGPIASLPVLMLVVGAGLRRLRRRA